MGNIKETETTQNKDFQPETKPLEGKYFNHFRIGSTEDVFVFDYYHIFPENDYEKNLQLFNNPKLRVILSPSDAKQFSKQLRSAIEKYEADKNEIVTINNNSDK